MDPTEVIATLASRALGRDVHPNDHVTPSQSSNDPFPTTIHVAATEAVLKDVIPALEHLAGAIETRAAEWADVVKSGRTHLMDAVPITLGQEAGAWASQVRFGIERIESGLAPAGGAAGGGAGGVGGGG